MSRFRSKPVEIEAELVTEKMIQDHLFDGVPLPNGMVISRASYNSVTRKIDAAYAHCVTRQGEVPVVLGDWVIQESDGSGCYPCKPDVFAAKYEAIEP